MHIDGVESMGFCVHYKMPNYVTFQSDLDRLRATQFSSKAKCSDSRVTQALKPDQRNHHPEVHVNGSQ